MKILGFGDYLMHFSPNGHERFMQASDMHLTFTGAEANVCSALALWGEDVGFVTRLPHHVLAERGITTLRALGIDTRFVARGGERMGIYFLENGVSLRPSSVIYDRAHSAFTEAEVCDFDIDGMLDSVELVVLSGITPALSSSLFDASLVLLKRARERGIQTLLDVNYRPTLLTKEKAGENLRALAPYITTLISNEEHLKMLLGIESAFGEDEAYERLKDIAKKAKEHLHIDNIAVTVRRTITASENAVMAAYARGEEYAVSPLYRISVVDRVGSGDAFTAGLIYAMRRGFDVEESVNFAVASSAYKHTVESDVNFATVDEIRALLRSGRLDVRR